MLNFREVELIIKDITSIDIYTLRQLEFPFSLRKIDLSARIYLDMGELTLSTETARITVKKTQFQIKEVEGPYLLEEKLGSYRSNITAGLANSFFRKPKFL